VTGGRLWAAASLCGVLMGCAHVAEPLAGVDRFEGRLSVQVANDSERSFTAGFQLSGSAERGRLLLTTPLGTQAAQADWSAQAVRLSASDGDRTYADLDSLSREILGEVVPLAAMFDWLHGRPWPSAPSQVRPGGFEQLGWLVDVSRRDQGWLMAQRSAPPMVTIRVKLDASGDVMARPALAPDAGIRPDNAQ
jgi:outer membrane lipoprotein LolB